MERNKNDSFVNKIGSNLLKAEEEQSKEELKLL